MVNNHYSSDICGTDRLHGLRIRYAVNINVLGLIAVPFISLTDISREELTLYQCPLGVYIIRIIGLCAGLSVHPRHDAPGYITYVRCEKSRSTQASSEKCNFEWYKTNALLPCIEHDIKRTMIGKQVHTY